MPAKYQLAEAEKEIERLREIMRGWQEAANEILKAPKSSEEVDTKHICVASLLRKIRDAKLGGE